MAQEQIISKEELHEGKRKLQAPVAGTVLGLKANTVGGVVTAADTLMTIVPDVDAGSGAIEVEAQLPNKDIGYVVEGQSVAVKLETYTFTRYGTVPGTVRKVGRDSVQMQGPDGKPSGELLFPVRIALNRTTIKVDGREQAIVPGMKVVAEIKTEERQVIGFLLDQVFAKFWTAGRER
jgi:hemolysin D